MLVHSGAKDFTKALINSAVDVPLRRMFVQSLQTRHDQAGRSAIESMAISF
jgi:hypothetical protein